MRKEMIRYIIFGIATTFVNIFVYYMCQKFLNVSYLLANATAWFSSVLFAFITNKIFVFEQRIWSFKIVVKEMRIFFTARIATGILDMMLMWVFVDILLISEMGTKVIVNVVVILLNYILSKWLVFQ